MNSGEQGLTGAGVMLGIPSYQIHQQKSADLIAQCLADFFVLLRRAVITAQFLALYFSVTLQNTLSIHHSPLANTHARIPAAQSAVFLH